MALYFPGADGRLHTELRELPIGERPEDGIAAIVAAIVEGPRTDGLFAPLPEVRATLEAAAATARAEAEAARGGGAEGPAPEPTGTTAPPPGGDGTGPRAAIGVYWIGDTVYVDLPSPSAPLAVGANQELLMLYSLVNSVLLGTPEARRLVVLWDGRQPLTFAGHIDTGRPLGAKRALLAEPSP